MTWDIDFFKPAGSLELFPNHIHSLSLGTTEDVQRAIGRVVPDVTWKGSQGYAMYMGLRLEFTLFRDDNMVRTGPVDRVGLFAEGTGYPVPLLAAMCRECEWVACDLGSFELMDFRRMDVPMTWSDEMDAVFA